MKVRCVLHQPPYDSTAMSTSDSYVYEDAPPETSSIEQDELDSLPSSTDSSEAGSEESSDAQKEWEASLQQLELMLTMVIVPFAGKYLGRKFAYWSEFDEFKEGAYG